MKKLITLLLLLTTSASASISILGPLTGTTPNYFYYDIDVVLDDQYIEGFSGAEVSENEPPQNGADGNSTVRTPRDLAHQEPTRTQSGVHLHQCDSHNGRIPLHEIRPRREQNLGS